MITIERITPGRSFDIAEINRLIVQLDPNRPTITEEDIAEIIRNPNYHFLVARDGDRYVGLWSCIFVRDLGRWICWGYNFVVDEKERGRGIGDLLLSTGLGIMRAFSREQRTALQPSFTTNPTRTRSDALHRKYGFIRVAEAVEAAGSMGTNFYKIIINPDD